MDDPLEEAQKLARQKNLFLPLIKGKFKKEIQKLLIFQPKKVTYLLQLSRHSCVRRSSKISPTENPFGGSASTSFLHFWRFWLGKWRNAPGKETLHCGQNVKILSKNWNKIFLGPHFFHRNQEFWFKYKKLSPGLKITF